MNTGLENLRPRVNAEQIGKLYGISAESVRRFTRLGIIPARKIGRLVRYDVAEVEDALRRAAEDQRSPK